MTRDKVTLKSGAQPHPTLPPEWVGKVVVMVIDQGSFEKGTTWTHVGTLAGFTYMVKDRGDALRSMDQETRLYFTDGAHWIIGKYDDATISTITTDY